MNVAFSIGFSGQIDTPLVLSLLHLCAINLWAKHVWFACFSVVGTDTYIDLQTVTEQTTNSQNTCKFLSDSE